MISIGWGASQLSAVLDRQSEGRVSQNARVDLAALSVELRPGWEAITDTLEDEPRPWTLARPDGGGALQFSTARYKGGPVPNPSLSDLLEMVRDFGGERGLDAPTDLRTEEGAIRSAAGSYHWQGSFLRIWYLSDGASFIFVTYLSTPTSLPTEVAECEQMLKTVRFSESRSGPTRS